MAAWEISSGVSVISEPFAREHVEREGGRFRTTDASLSSLYCASLDVVAVSHLAETAASLQRCRLRWRRFGRQGAISARSLRSAT